MSQRLPAHQVEGLATGALDDFDGNTPPAGGDVPTWDPDLGKYVPAPAAARRALVPLTTVVNGIPQLVWEADDNLSLTEVPLT